MPSQAMQNSIEALRDRRKASATQAPASLEERRAAFVPGDRLHPVPGDVLVTDVTASTVPAHWLADQGTDPGQVLLFLHRSDLHPRHASPVRIRLPGRG